MALGSWMSRVHSFIRAGPCCAHDGSGFCPGIIFLYLKIDRETAWRRVASRKGHFMPASLVDSQFADLEEPLPREHALTLEAEAPLEATVARIIARYSHCSNAGVDVH